MLKCFGNFFFFGLFVGGGWGCMLLVSHANFVLVKWNFNWCEGLYKPITRVRMILHIKAADEVN